MIHGESASNISRLTELLAAHGVYALTIIFIFYQQWRAGRNLKTAEGEDHAYFRKVNTSVIIATYTLVVISTIVWIYATFIYIPKFFIKGSVSGLTEQSASPQKAGDPPKVVELIAPESLDVDLYQGKKNIDEASTEGKYDLGWILLPHENLQTLVFRFQHHYEIPTKSEETPDRAAAGRAKVESRTIPRRFTLDLHSYSPGSSIQLMYVPDSEDAVRKLGKIYLRDPNSSAPVEIPWEEVGRNRGAASASRRTEFSLLSTLAAYASSPTVKRIFGAKGDYDLQLGRELRERLGSLDLKTQLRAREILVGNGSRSFKFITDSLDASSETSYDKGVMLHNLATAVDEIDASGNPPPPVLNLRLATAFFDLQDYESSAHFFDRAGNTSLAPKELYYSRGFAYSKTKQYEKAISSYEQYLAKEHRPYAQAVTHDELGLCFDNLGHDEEAIKHYTKAIQIYPALGWPYNNLAYLYAERGVKLPEALSLVDRALKLEEKEVNNLPLVEDTKAWVLYKMGRTEEALLLIKDAAKSAPYDPDIRRHLQIIQKPISQNPVKN